MSWPDWRDGVVFLVGGGPSLFGFDFDELARPGWYAIGINQAMFDAPVCAGFSIDHGFIERREAALVEFCKELPLYLCPPPSWIERVKKSIPDAVLYGETRRAFSFDAGELHRFGGTSGYAALNMAAQAAKRIVLLGYDYKSAGDRHHYHEVYERESREGNQNDWRGWVVRYNDAVATALKVRDIQVVNASPDSAITIFPKMTIPEALAWAERQCLS